MSSLTCKFIASVEGTLCELKCVRHVLCREAPLVVQLSPTLLVADLFLVNVTGTLGTSSIVFAGLLLSSSDGWRGGLVMALFDVWRAGGTPRSIVDC